MRETRELEVKPIRVFEAFAGIGTQRMALRNLGVKHEVVAISEIDKFAIKSYEAIHGKVNNLGDISKINVKDIPDHDLFTYSFPCQDISVAGLGKGLDKNSGTRSGLLWECERIIEEKKPKYLLMENVKNLVGKKFKPDFDKWLERLEELGYSNYWQVLNARDYGIPQNRERVFCVSILGEHTPYEFPKGFQLDLKLKDILEDEVEEKFYLSQKQVDRITSSSYDQNRRRIQEKDYSDTLCARDYKDPKCVRVVAKEESGRMGKQAIETYNKNNTKHGDTINPFNKKISSDNGVSPTITTRPEGFKTAINVVDQFRVRKLTPKECWRLMGCSDEDFHKAEKVNSKTQLYKQAGNAIVVDVLEGIFRELFK